MRKEKNMSKIKWLSVGASVAVFLFIIGGCTIVPSKLSVDREVLNSIVRGDYDNTQPKSTDESERPDPKPDVSPGQPKQNDEWQESNENDETGELGESVSEAFDSYVDALEGIVGLFDTFITGEQDNNGDKEQTVVIEDTVENQTQRTGISPEFKAFMDEYEAFFGEYIDFMEEYEESEDTLGLLTDYIRFMEQYYDYCEALDEIDEDELTDAEALYMAEVTLRVEQKMLEALG